MVTSVTPEASEISFWVLFPPSEIHARYNAAAANPVGSFPATTPIFFAFLKISPNDRKSTHYKFLYESDDVNFILGSTAFRFVFSPNPATLAILGIPLTGSATGTFKSNSLNTSL